MGKPEHHLLVFIAQSVVQEKCHLNIALLCIRLFNKDLICGMFGVVEL